MTTISVGDTVTWTNADSGTPHTITSKSGGLVDTDISNTPFSFTFTKAGSYEFYCRYHSGMSGKVIVAEQSSPAVPSSPLPSSPLPSDQPSSPMPSSPKPSDQPSSPMPSSPKPSDQPSSPMPSSPKPSDQPSSPMPSSPKPSDQPSSPMPSSPKPSDQPSSPMPSSPKPSDQPQASDQPKTSGQPSSPMPSSPKPSDAPKSSQAPSTTKKLATATTTTTAKIYIGDAGCNQLCAELQSKCSSDKSCSLALECVSAQYKKAGAVDASIIPTCGQTLSPLAFAVFNRTVLCLIRQCITKSPLVCIPDTCYAQASACMLYQSCQDSLQCAAKIRNLIGTCDSKCLSTCAGSPTDGAPQNLFATTANCVLGSSACKSEGSSNLNQCGSQCGSAFSTCVQYSDCAAGLACLNSTDVNATTCLKLTPSGSDSRAALVAASLCRQTCVSGNQCSLSKIQASCQGNASCAWSATCRPITDTCKGKEQSSCSAPCSWDNVRDTCLTLNDPCSSLAQTQCIGACKWSTTCQDVSCENLCASQVQDCLTLDGCRLSLQCIRNQTFATCVALSTDAASISAFKAAYQCVSSQSCSGDLNQQVKSYGKNGSDSDVPKQDPTKNIPTAPINATSPAALMSQCPNCEPSLSLCARDAACASALDCASKNYQVNNYCGPDCLAQCSYQLMLNSTQNSTFVKAAKCFVANCTSCDKDCSSFITACSKDPDCSAGYKCMVDNRKNGRCTGECLTHCLAAVPISVGRDLLARVASCQVNCGSNKDCAASSSSQSCTLNSGTKALQFANCQWNSRCILKRDSCFDFANQSSCEANSCNWNGAFCNTLNPTCGTNNDPTSCNGAPGCFWAESCGANRGCSNDCNNKTLTCFQYDDCVSAWQCLLASSKQGNEQIQDCASDITNMNALSAFYDFSACFTSCRSVGKCDGQCAAQIRNCSASANCAAAVACINTKACQDSTCTSKCIISNTNAASFDRQVALDLLQCKSECKVGAKCGAISSSESCGIDSDCSWSQRCVLAGTSSCARFGTAKECLAANKNASMPYCNWDAFSSTCVGASTACFTPDQLIAPKYGFGEVSLALSNVSSSCSSSCHQDAVCVPNDSCDRSCFLARQACLNDDACLPVFACVKDCPDRNASCFNSCTKNGVPTTFKALSRCHTDCKLSKCSGAVCASTLSACMADTDCSAAYQAYSLRAAFHLLDKAGFDAVVASLTGASRQLFFNVSACQLRACDPFFRQHRSCSAINAFPFAGQDFQQFFCGSSFSQCLSGDATGGAPLPCFWNATTSQCGCNLNNHPEFKQKVCQSGADNCFQCCAKDHTACLNAQVFGDCSNIYNNCTSSCSAALYDTNTVQNKVDVTLALNFTTGTDSAQNVTVDSLVNSVLTLLNDSTITAADVFVLTVNQTNQDAPPARRRGTSGIVNVNYVIVIRVDSGAASTVTATVNNVDTTTVLNSLMAAGIDSSSVDVNTVSVVTATAAPTATTSAPTYYYLVVSPLLVLPAGASLTSLQQDDLIASYIAAYSLPVTTSVTVTVVNGLVTAQYTVLGQPSSLLLDPQVVTVTYTAADGSTVTTTTLVATSSASTGGGGGSNTNNNGGSSSSSSVLIGAAVGGAVGGVLLVLLVVAIMVRRREHVPTRKVSSSRV